MNPERNIYKQRPQAFDRISAPVYMDRCRWKCFGWHPYQCSRKAVVKLDGYGFCKQHAKMWKERG